MKNIIKKFSLLFLVLIFSTVSLVGCGKTNDLVRKMYDYYEDSSLQLETTYAYDKEGRLCEEIEKLHHDVDDVETTKKVYNYDGDLLCYTELYDLEGENKWVKSYCKIYGYDENGNQISFFGYSVSGDEKTLFAMDIMEYNASGKEIKTTSILTDEGDEKKPLTAFSVVKKAYNESGDLKRVEYYDIFDEDTFELLEELELHEYYLYSYNADGTISEIEEYDSEDTLLYTTRYTYDKNGKETAEEMYSILDGAEKLIKKITFKYDKNNRLIKETRLSLKEKTGKLEYDGHTVYEY